MTAAQQAHRALGLVALLAVAVALFLVGLAAFRDAQPSAISQAPARERVTSVPQLQVAAAERLRQLRAVADEGDTAVRRVFVAVLAILVIAVVMLGLAAFGEAPATLVRLTTGLVALSALNAILVLTRDVSAGLAALLVLTVAATLIVAARIVGRHVLLDSPWPGVRV